MAGTAWYVLHSKPKQERQVTNCLLARGVEVFFPAAKVKPVNPRCSTLRAYFPGYLFTYVDLDSVGISSLQWVPGAIGLVQFGGEPAVVPDHFIHDLKQRIAEIAAAGGLHLDGLKSGDTVRLTSGPFAGCDASFDKTRDVAHTLRIQSATLNEWSAEFDRFLSPLAHSTGNGDERDFSDNDVCVLATVAELRNQGWSADQITWVLDHAQAEVQVPRLREGLLRVEYEHALDIVKRLENETQRLIGERNAAFFARDSEARRLNDWIAALQEELGKTRGQLDTIQHEWMPMHVVLRIVVAVAIAAIVIVLVALVLLLRCSV